MKQNCGHLVLALIATVISYIVIDTNAGEQRGSQMTLESPPLTPEEWLRLTITPDITTNQTRSWFTVTNETLPWRLEVYTAGKLSFFYVTNPAPTLTVESTNVALVLNSNVMQKLIASGEVCKVAGHNWRNGRPGESDGFSFADYHPNTAYRTCKLCWVCQSRDTDAWK